MLALAAPAPARGAVALTRGPYLTKARRTSVTVVWRTDVAGTSVVRWGAGTALDRVATGPDGTTHKVRLTGLTPGARYSYRVETGGLTFGRRRAFRALDAAHDPSFRFAVVGDFGTGSAAEVAVEDRIVLAKPRLLMTVGDNAYSSGSDAELDARVFPQYADLIDHVAINVVLGNHDVGTAGGAPERDAFSLGPRAWYSFDASSAHFVVLDSNEGCITAGCPQYDWLVSDLSHTPQPYRFVFFHHTISSCGPHGTDTDLRAAWAPVFAAHGVQVVFMGHDHGYQRSVPIDGVVYVTAGGGGAGLYAWTKPCAEAAVVLDATSVPDASHFVLVTLAADGATVSAIDRAGTVRDSFRVVP
ncbi:metallophosphoesterase family protein [Candidatus Binatia bacterium]|nr:metallophosphoesterase family protein [Candidatus Binatia bacterium]